MNDQELTFAIPHEITNSRNNGLTPLQNIKESIDISKELSTFANSMGLISDIPGKKKIQDKDGNFETISVINKHMNVEGWQFALSLLGVFPIVTEVKDLSRYNPTTGELIEYKYFARVNLTDRDGKIVGYGESICSNLESKKRSFEEFAVHSMAQTRAIGKAARNFCGWLAKASGFDTTPTEEVEFKIDNISSAVEIEKVYRQHALKIKNTPELLSQIQQRKADIIEASENAKIKTT